MLRAFHPFNVPVDARTLTLSREESFHLVKVLRARSDEPIRAFDGRGNVWDARPISGDARALTLEIVSREHIAPPKCSLALALALPKGSLADEIVRSATEIGMAEFFPILAARSEVKLDAARAGHKRSRWQAIAVEACKQCGNPFVPEIFPVVSAKDFFEKMTSPAASADATETISADAAGTLKLTASLERGARSCREVFAAFRTASDAGAAPRKILWLVGPEGDFTAEEYASARAAGFVPARLGKLVLRVPTAALYCLAVADRIRSDF